MKKMLLGVAAAIVALASCSKTEVTDLAGPQEIGFKPIAGIQTKAEHAATTLPESVSMGVAAYFTGDNEYFGRTEFTHSASGWGGSKYWPQTGTLDFYMYAPFNPKITISKDKISSGANLVANTTDLLYGSLTEQAKTSAAISTTLKHAGAKVCFTGKVTGGATVKVLSVQLLGFPNNGKVNITPSVPKVEWTEQTTKGDVTFTPNNGLVLSGESAAICHGDGTGLENQGILVIPHTLTEATQIKVTYSIDGKTVPTAAEFTLTGNTWDPGKKYTYNFNFTSEEILFNPTVSDFDNTTPATDKEI